MQPLLLTFPFPSLLVFRHGCRSYHCSPPPTVRLFRTGGLSSYFQLLLSSCHAMYVSTGCRRDAPLRVVVMGPSGRPSFSPITRSQPSRLADQLCCGPAGSPARHFTPREPCSLSLVHVLGCDAGFRLASSSPPLRRNRGQPSPLPKQGWELQAGRRVSPSPPRHHTNMCSSFLLFSCTWPCM